MEEIDLDAEREKRGFVRHPEGSLFEDPRNGDRWTVTKVGGYSGGPGAMFLRPDDNGVLRSCGYVYECINEDQERRAIYGDQIGHEFVLIGA